MKNATASIFKTFFLSLCIIANTQFAYAQTASILPPAKTTFVDQNGKPLTAGKVEFFIPSTTTHKTTWQDAAETVPNTNPVTLDSAGRALILGSGSYRQVVKDKLGNLIWDQVTSSTGTSSSGPTATGDGDLVGTIKPWAGMTAPNQYLFTNGQELSRTTYSVLFTAITSTQSVFCTSGSPTLSGLSDTTNFWIGMQLEIPCVVAGNTTVVSKTASSVNMAANSNVTTNATAIFFPWGGGNHTNTFNVPDFRGFAIAGNNNMGGVAAVGRLTTTFFGVTDPNSSGATGGRQSLNLVTSNLPAQTPTGTITNGAITSTTPQLGGVAGTTQANSGQSTLITPAAIVITSSQATSTFNGTAFAGQIAAPFATVQPTITSNYIIKVLPDANSATASGVTAIQGMTGSIACGSTLTCTGNIITVNLPASPLFFASSYGVLCDGTTDDSTAMQNAITAAQGRTIYMPAGTCRINTQLVAQFSNGQTFQPGLSIQGSGGFGSTIFDTRVASNCMILAQGTADNFFAGGVTLKDIKITSLGATAGACGVEFYRVAYAKMDNVWMQNLAGNGFFLPASAGDADASFAVIFDRVRMDNVATTNGAFCANFLGPTGGWALSNLRITNSNFSGCGNLNAVIPPTSGAIQAKVLVAQVINTTFTFNNNIDLYIQGADQSSNITITGSDFENLNSSTLPHIYVDGGLRNFTMTESQCLNNDSHIAAGCAWFNTTSVVIGDVTLANIQVRATSLNNPYTAFQTTGANGVTNTINVDNVFWQTFDTAGQTRFSGFTFKPISGQVNFSISAANTAKLIPIGYGACLPIKLAATGEWVCYQVPTAGITIAALGGATPTTSYNFYAANTAAANLPLSITIERATTATALDTTGGYNVKSGDSTRTFIGSATSDGAGSFQIGGTSWYPPSGVTSVGSITGLGTGVATALGVNIGTAGSFIVNGGVLGSPSSIGTLPAYTLGGTISGGGNQINNVVIGSTTPLAGTFTTLTANTSISSPIHTSSGSHTFQSNGSTFAGLITTGQQWFLGGTSNTPPTGPIVTVSKNTAATVALGTPSGIAGTAQAVMTLVGVDGSPADINVQAFGNTNTPAAIRFFHAAGSAGTPTATQTATTMGNNVFYGFKTASGSAYVAGGGILATSTNNWDNAQTGMRLDFLATAAGTTGFTTSASVGAGLMVGTTTDPGAGAFLVSKTYGAIPTVFGSLVTCNAAAKGFRAFITDELAAVAFNTAATGGGANNVPVFCDGTSWRIG